MSRDVSAALSCYNMKHPFGSHDSGLSDDAYLTAYRDTRDMDALGHLFSRYADMIFGVCMKYLGNPTESEDATMEIFELLAEKLPNQEVISFRGWLYVVVKNHCLQILRRKKQDLTEVLQTDTVYSEDGMHPEDTDINWQENGLQDCLHRLPEMQRKSIELFYLRSMSYTDVSEALMIGKEQVRSHIQNGRRNLRICMSRKQEEQKLKNA